MNPLTNVWSFQGRIGRADFFFGIIFNSIVVSAIFALAFFLQLALGMPAPREMPWVLAVLSGFGVLLGLWLNCALAAKRFHDLGRSGWFVLLLVVPFVDVFVLLYMLFARGADGDNDYGPAGQVHGKRLAA